ncbi:MAG: AAA domain-containing protein [Nitritalea sp.]
MQEFLQQLALHIQDLSKRNPAIYLPRPLGPAFIDTCLLEGAMGAQALPGYFQFRSGEEELPILLAQGPYSTSENALSAQLFQLAKWAHRQEEESGTVALALGWPFVLGTLLDGAPIAAPLFVLPVQLLLRENTWRLQATEEGLQWNSAFLAAYFQGREELYPLEALQDCLEQLLRCETVGDFLALLYPFLKKHLALHFNQDLFSGRLQAMPEAALPEESGQGRLKLYPFQVLGGFGSPEEVFLQALSAPHYQAFTTVEAYVEEKFASDRRAKQPMQAAIYSPYPLDASQEEVLQRVAAGDSFVLQGPPGSGKSQVITALVADALARGKKVLVVAKKQVALEVVEKRMATVGLDAYAALIPHMQFRSDLETKILERLSALSEEKRADDRPEIMLLERRFQECRQHIQQRSGQLEQLCQALFETDTAGGWSARTLYGHLAPYSQAHLERLPDMRAYASHFPMEGLSALPVSFALLAQMEQLQQRELLWALRQPFPDTADPQVQVEQQLDVLNELERILLEIKPLIESERQLGALLLAMGEADWSEREKIAMFYARFEGEPFFRELLDQDLREVDIPWLVEKYDIVKRLLAGVGPAWSVPLEEVPLLLEQCLAYEQGWDQSLFGFRLAFWQREEKRRIQAFMAAEGLPFERSALKKFITMLENRLNLRHQLTLLGSKTFLVLPEVPFRFALFSAAVSGRIRMLQALQQLATLRCFTALKPLLGLPPKKFQAFWAGMDKLEELRPRLSLWFTEKQIAAWARRPDLNRLRSFREQLRTQHAWMYRFDAQCRRLAPQQEAGMRYFVRRYRGAEAGSLEAAFALAIAWAWLRILEQKYPELSQVRAGYWEEVLHTLQGVEEERRQLARTIIGLKVRALGRENLQYNRLGHLVSYRDLGKELRKKRRRLPLKQVLAQHGEALFQLMPAWLCSPHAAMTLFRSRAAEAPPFDLIVFDESSQIPTAEAFPLLELGRQFVVVGDRQQLRPHALFRKQYAEASAHTEESWLHWAGLYVPEHMLLGHYRARHEALIAFSNQHFYGGRLRILPDRATFGAEEPPFHYQLVEGVYAAGENVLEAEALVAYILRQPPVWKQKCVGIVALNQLQSQLLYRLLWEALEGQIPAGWQVRHLQEVQGEEYDLVCISTVYARTAKGSFPSSLGWISLPGAAQRVNVLASRAREQLALFTGIEPHLIGPGMRENEGVRMLLAFLEQVKSYRKRSWPAGKGGKSLDFDPLRAQLCSQVPGAQEFPYGTLVDIAIRDAEGNFTGEVVLRDREDWLLGPRLLGPFVYDVAYIRARGWEVRWCLSPNLYPQVRLEE